MEGPLETIDVVVNSRSRRGQWLFERCLSQFQVLGLQVRTAQCVSRERDLQLVLASLIDHGARAVAVGGGDGTMRIAAEILAGQETALGVLPLGTGNSFSRDLGIGHDVDKACQVIAGGRAVPLDIGRANGRVFLNVATIGLSTLIALELDPIAKRRFGLLSYLAPALQALKAAKPFRVRIERDEETQEFEALQMVVGNGRHHAGPFPITDRAGLTSGELHAYVLATRDKVHLVRFLAALGRGEHQRLDLVHSFDATAFDVDALPGKRVAIDGDVILRTPVRFRASPERLVTIVPAEFDASSW